MDDERVESLIRLALEFWCRGETVPAEVKLALAGVSNAQRARVWEIICREAESC